MKLFKIRQNLANVAPWIGRYRRFFSALLASIKSTNNSYSQFQEDRFIYDLFQKFNIPKSDLYIDVGANHPTDLSNTYLLYRLGYRGITIEPNVELVNLHRLFRPKDIALAIGCGDYNTVLTLNISVTPVRSSFLNDKSGKLIGKIAVPVMRLDDILTNIAKNPICMMSIDVEGMNDAVLRGTEEALKRTRILCLEYDNESDKENYNQILPASFSLAHQSTCNLIYINNNI